MHLFVKVKNIVFCNVKERAKNISDSSRSYSQNLIGNFSALSLTLLQISRTCTYNFFSNLANHLAHLSLTSLCPPLRTLLHKTRFSEPTTKIWMMIDPYYQRQKNVARWLYFLAIQGLRRYWRGSLGSGEGTSAGSLNVYVGGDGRRCRSLRR